MNESNDLMSEWKQGFNEWMKASVYWVNESNDLMSEWKQGFNE